MKRKIGLAELIAFVVSTLGVAFVWSLVFVPGQLGANVPLGIAVALFLIYQGTTHIARWLVEKFFNAGSEERALLLHSAQAFLRVHRKDLVKFKKKAKLNTPVDYQKYEGALTDLRKVIEGVLKHWKASPKKVAEQIEHMNTAFTRAKSCAETAKIQSKKLSLFDNVTSLVTILAVALLIRTFVIGAFQIPSSSMVPSLQIGDHLFVNKLAFGIVNPFPGKGFWLQWAEPKPGDVVVFDSPSYVSVHANQPWVKRAIAIEGQRVRLQNDVLYVDDQPYPHVAEAKADVYNNFETYGGELQGHWVKQPVLRTTEQIGARTHEIYIPDSPTFYPGLSNWPYFGMKKLPGLACDGRECTVEAGYIFVVGDNRGGSGDSRMWGALEKKRLLGKPIFVWMSVDGAENFFKVGPVAVPKFRLDRMFVPIH